MGSQSPRRISQASSASGYCSDDRDRQSVDSGCRSQHWRYSFRKCEWCDLLVHNVQVTIVILSPDEEERRESRDELGGSRDSPVRVSVSISGAAAGASWRKESVTIVEGQEPGEDEEAGPGQARLSVESGGSPVVSGARQQLLSIPSTTITNSSSAETLTDNTITGPDTPTSVTAMARWARYTGHFG